MIKFECQKCGSCCKNSTGWVYVDPYEIENISKFLKIPTIDFIDKYLEKNKGWLVLSKPGHNENCFLDEENECQIYPVRPKNCKEYPFWQDVLQSRETFLKEAENCKGLKYLINNKKKPS